MKFELKIDAYPGFAVGHPSDQLAWSHDELLALAEDNAARDRKPFRMRESLAGSREQCDALYFATRSLGYGIDDLRPAVQHEAPLGVLAEIEMPGHPRLALAIHRFVSVLHEIAADRGKSSRACQKRWSPVFHTAHGATRSMMLGRRSGPVEVLHARCHGLSVLIELGVCTISAEGHRFDFDRVFNPFGEVKAPFNDAQVPRLRRLFSAWKKLRREWISDHVVVAMPGYHSSAGDVAKLVFVPHSAARGMRADASYAVDGRPTPESIGALVLDTTYIDRDETYRLVGAMARSSRYGFRQEIDAAFLSDLTETLRVLRGPLPTTEELLASMDESAKRFIEARRGREVVALDDPTATSYTVYQDDMTFPRALTTTKWLSTAIDIERANRKEVTWRLRMQIGSGKSRAGSQASA